MAKSIERGALIAAFGTADAMVLVDLHDVIANAARDLPEFALLVGGRLINGLLFHTCNSDCRKGWFH
jgi:hypothetical protein